MTLTPEVKPITVNEQYALSLTRQRAGVNPEDPSAGYDVEFCEVAHGLRILGIARHMGWRCGYVRIPRSHPFYGMDDRDEELWTIPVHGGFTFAGRALDDSGWWLGFDCMHLGDGPDTDLIIDELRKAHYMEYLYKGAKVWTTDDVYAECVEVAEALAKVNTWRYKLRRFIRRTIPRNFGPEIELGLLCVWAWAFTLWLLM